MVRRLLLSMLLLAMPSGVLWSQPIYSDVFFLGTSALDTGNWLLLQSFSNPRTGLAEVALYGTKPNRTVELTRKVYDRVPAPTQPQFVTDPKQPRGTTKQSDTARGGMTIDVHRIITENGVRQQPDLFRTKFKSWPNIFVYNPADMGPDGRPLFMPGAVNAKRGASDGSDARGRRGITSAAMPAHCAWTSRKASLESPHMSC